MQLHFCKDNNFFANNQLYLSQPKHKSVQWKIEHVVSLVKRQSGDFAGVFWLVLLAEECKTFGLEVFACLDFVTDFF
jgi:hypothetical protein